jgi:nucleoside-diphosphate-sugar epimerase
MNKTVVIFGATGLVGNELLHILADSDEYKKIVAVCRKALLFTHPKLETILLSDFSDLLQIKEKLKADSCFCCIGTTIKTAGSKDAFRKVDYFIPKQIAQLAEELSIPDLVIISSIGANPATSNFYLKTKGEMEKTTREIFKGNLKIVRPSLLMGKRSEFRFGERAAIIFMKSFGWMLFGHLKKYRGIYARDVARAMLLISHSSPENIIFESDELNAVIARQKK